MRIFKCSLLSNELKVGEPGLFEQNKRPLSIYSTNEPLPLTKKQTKKNVASNRIESDDENDNQSNSSVPNNQFKSTQAQGQLKEVIDNSKTDSNNSSSSVVIIRTNSKQNKTKKNVASNRIESDDENENQSNSSVPNNQFKSTQSQLKEVIDNSKTDSNNSSSSVVIIQTNSKQNEINDLKVENLIELANKNEFPHKLFIIEGKEHLYTPVCHFFKSETIFANKPKSVKFECIIKKCVLNCSFGAFTNLNKHLLKHDSMVKCFFDARVGQTRL